MKGRHPVAHYILRSITLPDMAQVQQDFRELHDIPRGRKLTQDQWMEFALYYAKRKVQDGWRMGSFGRQVTE